MKKEILNLLDEKNVDFGRLSEFYSGIKKVYTDKSSGIKTGFIGNALSKERLEADIDYCIKNYTRNTKDKSKWLKKSGYFKKIKQLNAYQILYSSRFQRYCNENSKRHEFG